jgi:hypothetical protein
MDILRGFENPIRFTEEEIKKCEDSKDFRKIFFDYYIFVIELVTVSVSIRADSPWINKALSKLDWGILVWLLNRIRKTMYAQLPLIVEQKHNEVLMMLDRAILESCLNISWIIENLNEESSKKFVAYAIKKDLDLESLIHENSSNQGRELYEVEKRLINQRKLRIGESWMEELEIRELAKQYPDIKTLFKEVWDNGTMYAFWYTMQSHTVHWDWIWLRYMGYLKNTWGVYAPIIDDNEFDPVQLLGNITFIFDILTKFYSSVLDIDLNAFFENEKGYIESFYNKHNELNNIILK